MCTYMYCVCVCRLFRIMDDDGSKSLDFSEFKKGIHDYGINMDDEVCHTNTANHGNGYLLA